MKYLALLLLLPLAASGQFTTNAPGIRTNILATGNATNAPGGIPGGSTVFNTNAPVAALVGSTNWLPAPAFTGWWFHNLSNNVGVATNTCVRLTGLSWTNTARTSNGTLEVWANYTGSLLALKQTFPLTNSLTNTSLICSNLLWPWDGYYVRLRYRQGAYGSPFSAMITNTSPSP